MVPKADSGTFLLLFLLVLSITEPLRPGRGGGAGGVPVLPPQPTGGSRARSPAGRRGCPGAGERAAGPAGSASAERRPREVGAGAVPLPAGTGRRGEPRSGVAVARRRCRARGLVRAQPAASLPLLYAFKKRRDLAGSWGETSVPCAGWLGPERTLS